MTLSAPIKIFALLGVLAALALGASTFVLGGVQEDVLAEPILLPKKKGGVLDVPAIEKKVTAVASPKPKAAKPKPAVPVRPKPVPVVATNGLPTVLVNALAANAVVVVALYGDDGKVDPLARDEAEAGAKLAGAGFVALDVTRDQKAAEALVMKLGAVLRAPAVLVYTRPDVLSIQLDGFRDRDTVAQAAQNALR